MARETPNPQSSKGLRLVNPSVAAHLPHDTCQRDENLAQIVDAWPRLPDAIKAGIMAMVKAALGK
jgi:hypothetical protein